MSVLKDMECQVCHEVREALLPSDTEQTGLDCSTCNTLTTHVSTCCGGLKSRYRFNDWHPGCSKFEYTGVDAYHENDDGTERPSVDLHTGQSLFDNNPERIAEERAKARSRRGKSPLYFTRKGR